MKVIKKHPFTATGEFTGLLLPAEEATESIVLTGSKKQPGEALMLSHGGNAWSQEPQVISLLNGEVIISTSSELQWNEGLATTWVNALIRHIGLKSEHLNEIKQYCITNNVFELLSGCCVSYATRDSETGEISVGVSAHTLPMLDVLRTTGSVDLRADLNKHLPNQPVLVSHVFNLTYLNQTEVVWAFGADTHAYTTNSTYSLATGGGRYYTEIKLAGSGLKASYVVKKDIDLLDPTEGLFSGISDNLSIGDTIHILDTSTHTTLVDGVWTWVGDYSQIPYVWHICDISNPIVDTKNLTVSSLVFPIKVVNDSSFDTDFRLI